MKWLITGGCGFIGTNLIAKLVTDVSNRIRVVDNLNVGKRDDLGRVCQFSEVFPSDRAELPPWTNGHPVQLAVGDILDEDLALRAALGADVIVHLAAKTGVPFSLENPRLDCTTNILGLLNYLEAARGCGVKRFIFASSGAPIGECEPPIHEEMACHPVSPYGASKLAGEAYCSAYYHSFGVETVALRFGNVYGPGAERKTSVVPKFIRRAIKGEPLEIFGDGKQTRDFIFVDDLVRAVILAAQANGVGGHIFQIATNRETTVTEITEKLVRHLDDAGIRNVQVRHAHPRHGDVKRNFSDTSKAKRILGWEAETDLDSGIGRTVTWWLSNRHDQSS
ncbi:MAG: NAD-dependent epimerase/dehydratase family protein [Thermodesulfobacteriota bacterium]